MEVRFSPAPNISIYSHVHIYLMLILCAYVRKDSEYEKELRLRYVMRVCGKLSELRPFVWQSSRDVYGSSKSWPSVWSKQRPTLSQALSTLFAMNHSVFTLQCNLLVPRVGDGGICSIVHVSRRFRPPLSFAVSFYFFVIRTRIWFNGEAEDFLWERFQRTIHKSLVVDAAILELLFFSNVLVASATKLHEFCNLIASALLQIHTRRAFRSCYLFFLVIQRDTKPDRIFGDFVAHELNIGGEYRVSLSNLQCQSRAFSIFQTFTMHRGNTWLMSHISKFFIVPLRYFSK